MPALAELLKGALTLDSNERAALAEQLLASLDGSIPEDAAALDAMWLTEAERRLADLRSGGSVALSAESVAEKARKRFR